MNEFNQFNRRASEATSKTTATASSSRGTNRPALIFVALLSLIVLGGGLLMGLTSCGDTPTSISPTTAPGQPSDSRVIPGNGGSASNSNATADPYASLTQQQVMDTFIKAYQAKDFKTCKALISPMVRAGWDSPDELDLQVAQAERENGALEVINYGMVQGSDTGSKVSFVLNYKRTLPTNQPTITPGHSLGGGTVGATYQATEQARYNDRHNATYQATIEIRRENNAYKIMAYTIF